MNQKAQNNSKPKGGVVTTAPVVVAAELARLSIDFNRDGVVAVFSFSVPGLPSGKEEAVIYKLSSSLQSVQAQIEAINRRLIQDAQTRGLIPAGTVA